MTREQWKEKLPLIQAFVDGKDIEVLNYHDGKWKVNDNIQFTSFIDGYRIKSKPKYRPFKNADECFEEMRKHEPFGWIKRISNNEYIYINRITQFHIGYSQMMYVGFDLAFRKFQFLDDTLFGIKEE